MSLPKMPRVGQNHIYTVCIRCFWHGTHQLYGHIRGIYTVLANSKNTASHLASLGHAQHLQTTVCEVVYLD
jgi:hypothetical protein